MAYKNEARPFSKQRETLIDLLPLSTPLTMYVDPSNRCNLQCKFCFQSQADLRSKMDQTVMSEPLFERIVAGIKDFDKRIKKIHLHGFGEPLLNKNIAKMIRKFRLECAERVALTTNATALTTSLSEQLIKSGLDEINISIYAMDNESFYKFTNKSLDVNKIEQNVRFLYQNSRGTNLKIHVKYVGNVNQSKSTDKFRDSYSGIADTIWIDNATNIWPGMDITEQLELANGLTNQYGLNFPTSKRPVCPQIFYQLLIHSNGMVSPCCADFAAEKVIGNLHESSLIEIWNGFLLQKLRQDHITKNLADHPVCQSCDYPSNGSTVSLEGEIKKLRKIFLN